MAEAELRNMIMNFRVSDLQVLLGFAGRNKTGKKQELQSRALDLLKLKSHAAEMKIRELDTRRYHHNQLTVRPVNYELRERTMNDHPSIHYDPRTSGNTYPAHCNPSVRPTPMAHASSASYTSSTKTYMPPVATNINVPAQYTSYADVKFKDLPFYDILYVLARPSSLVPDAAERYQETPFYFTLSPHQAHDLAVSKGLNGNYECQILLRFCLLETGTEQEDNFPPSISVKVNGKIAQLPNPIPTNRPGVEPKRPSKPVNITSLTKLSPVVQNVVTISWASTYGRSYAAAMYIVRQLTSHTLLNRLRGTGVRSPDFTTVMIKEKLNQGGDDDIATTNLRVSLVCPLGKIRMELPCRSITCSHIQCFDAFTYIQMNEKKPKWICPVCDKSALFRALIIDGLFVDIASKVSLECLEVEFNDDGSWIPIIPVKEPKETKKDVVEKKNNSQPVEVVDIDSDSDDNNEVWQFNSVPLETIPSSLTEPQPVSLSPSTIFDHVENLTAANSYASSSHLSPFSSLNMSSNVQPECVLPDLDTSHLDSSMPSTSSSSPGLSSSSFPHIPFLTEAFGSSLSNVYSEQMAMISNSLNTNPYSNIDFSSFINIPDIDQQKLKEYDGKDVNDVMPDVISLE